MSSLLPRAVLSLLLCLSLGLPLAEALEVHIAWKAGLPAVPPAPPATPAQAYIVYRRDTPTGAWAEKLRTNAQTFEAVDATVVTDQTYWYMVRAWANNVLSPESEVLSVSTSQQVVSAPRDVVISVVITSTPAAGAAQAPTPGEAPAAPTPPPQSPPVPRQ